MKEYSFQQKLEKAVPPAPGPEARLRAKRAALAEFARVQAEKVMQPAASAAPPRGFKALLAAWRPTREDKHHGRDPMAWSSKNALLGVAASVCVAVFGITWIRSDSSLQEVGLAPEVVIATPVEPSVTEREPEQAVEQPQPADAPAKGAASTSVVEPKVGGPGTPRGVKSRVAKPPQVGPPVLDVVPMPPSEMETVVVTSERRAIQQSMEVKREATVTVDSRPRSRAQSPKSAVSAPATASSGSIGALFSRKKDEPRLVQPAPGYHETGRDQFKHFESNSVKRVSEEPVSTFSADVDTASYSFIRGQLNAGVLPQKDAVRVEEMINYFDYSWPTPPSREAPFQPTVIVSDSPWGKGKKLVHIGIKGYALDAAQKPAANLVLLLDVSGSMNSPDKLPLAVQSMEMLLTSLAPTDTVGIVVYAGAAGMVLEPTAVSEKQKIVDALRSLRPGGSTAGAAGIELAYQLAEASFRKGGVNRVLLTTDGDFNVGITNQEELKGFVERKREKGIFLSVLGFGQGNYHDQLAQVLAQNGNGVAAYIDSLSEAQKVLVQEATASLFTIAKDVKLQVEFNPATVAEYRLVGYETRALNREDFNNDAVDAGDVGSGHTVTAIYEIAPVGSGAQLIGKRRYQPKNEQVEHAGKAGEFGFLKIRYKLPDSDTSRLIEQPIVDNDAVPAALKRDVEFSTAVAGFAQLLRGGSFTGRLGLDDVIRQAQANKGEDPFGYRTEFVQLVRKAKTARGM